MSGLAPATEPRASATPRPEAEPFPEVNLIDRLLAEQQKLQTPVAQFSDRQEANEFPDRQALYRHLIPLEAPARGEQYAFQVELDKCTGCKACVTACHSLNGLDNDEAWRDVGTLTGGEDDPAWQQTVTTACHHCLDPECLTGCPVGAYDKDDQTGIVRHLDDQCIGCEYCVMKCPYDVPKYSKRRGIVRKCDMCHQRLAAGEAPACVQACPTEAIRIVTVESARSQSRGLPGTPDPALTHPTTMFTGRSAPATAVAADRDDLVPQPAHWPLVVMLVLTQAGLGTFAAGALTTSIIPLLAGATLFFGGLGASVLHLGRPLGAWRFFLGLRTSWLSREILAFGLVAPALLLCLALALLPALALPIPLAAFVIALSGAAVFTSVMVYADTGRPNWTVSRTAARFYGTTLSAFLLGSALAGLLSPLWFGAFLAVRLAISAIGLLRAFDRAWSPFRHAARLQTRPLKWILVAQMVSGIGAVVASPLWLPGAFALFLVGELAERLLFFRSVSFLKMPGSPLRASSH